MCLVTVVLAGRAASQPARSSDEAPAGAGRGAPTDPLLGGLTFTSSGEPITITSASLEFNYKTRLLTYKGGVQATQGDMKVESAILTVSLDERAEGRIREVVASGDVRLSKGERHATAGRAVFDQQKRTVTLSDNAVLHDGPNQVSGDRVVVYLDEQRSVVEGGSGRVKAVLFPPKEATPGSRP